MDVKSKKKTRLSRGVTIGFVYCEIRIVCQPLPKL